MSAAAPLLETRSSLIARLKVTINGESWEEFFNTYWELIYHVARRAAHGGHPHRPEQIGQ